MAEEKKAAEGKTMTRESVVRSQTAYEGKEHSDLVEVEIIADGKHVKKGQVKRVHPTMAAILEAKGLIKGSGKPFERPKFEQKDTTVDV